MKKYLLLMIMLGLTVGTTKAADSDTLLPKLQPANFNGRVTEWFTHQHNPAWGYAEDQTNSFIIVHPKDGDTAGRPLYVVLHSAGHDFQTALFCTAQEGNHDIYRAPDDFYALYVDCRTHQDQDWWWGEKKLTDANTLTPVEKRVLDTVRWAIAKYQIDPNRVYLSGNSMGGSGTLGIGLRHGDIFATIKANVPAGVRHAVTRLGLDQPAGQRPRLPDPPVCVDYSGTDDNWSKGHEIFFRGMHDAQYAVIGYWGGFGHGNNHRAIEKVNDLINQFDWTAVRKDAAYPVFTDATTDNPLPWPACAQLLDEKKNAEAKALPPGQINAYFRWRNISDTERKVEVELFLINAEKPSAQFGESPKEATVSVALRRLQNMRIQPGEEIKWSFGARQGTAKANADGLVTVEKLTIQREPQTLVLLKK